MNTKKGPALAGTGGKDCERKASYSAISEDATELHLAAAQLVEKRGRVELELIGAIVSDPRRAYPVAVEVGVTADLFDTDDRRLIFNAVYVKSELNRWTGDVFDDRLAVAMLAREGLREYHWWNPQGPISFNGEWSNETLVALFDSWFFSASIVQHFARQLIEIDRRQRAAQAAYRRCLALLEGNAEPDESAVLPSPCQRIVMLPLRQHRTRGAA